jgi:hypothetical protein
MSSGSSRRTMHPASRDEYVTHLLRVDVEYQREPVGFIDPATAGRPVQTDGPP